jgi:hypothetical protein
MCAWLARCRCGSPEGADAGAFAIGVILHASIASFGALTTALLYCYFSVSDTGEVHGVPPPPGAADDPR